MLVAQCEPLITKDYNLVQDFTNIVYNRYSSHPTVMVKAINNTYFTNSKTCMEVNELNGLIKALTNAFALLPEKDSYVEEYINKLKKLQNKKKTPTTDAKIGNGNSAITSQEVKDLIVKLDTLEKRLNEKIESNNQRIDSAEQKLDILLGLVILLGGVTITLLRQQGTKHPTGRSSRKKSTQTEENNDAQTPVAEPEPIEDAPKLSNTIKTTSAPSVAKAETPKEIAPNANLEKHVAPVPVPQPNRSPESIEPSSTYFYLSTPTSKEGRTTFVDQRSKEFDPTSLFYKFSLVKGDAHKALFWYVDDPDTVRSALDFPSRLLKPACIYDSNLDFDAKRIITDQPGIAILKGRVWEVKTKAQIRTV